MDERMTLLECEKRAQKEGFDSATFDLCGPLGKKQCKWADAYMGILEIDDKIVVITDKMYLSKMLWCENFSVGE